MLLHKLRKRRNRSLRTLDPAAFLPPAVGHHCTGVGWVGGGYCVWRFDQVLDDPGDGAGLLVNGTPPDYVAFSYGDAFVQCHYPVDPAPGDPWQYLGGNSPSFVDGLPGVPGSGVCTDG